MEEDDAYGYHETKQAFEEFMRDKQRAARVREWPMPGHLAAYREGQPIPYKVMQKEPIKPKVQRKDKSMKLRNAAIILDDTITSVKCVFGSSTTVYTYLCDKVIANTLHKDDKVVVESKDKPLFNVCTVVEVDLETDIDMDDSFEYIYVIQRVDTEYAKKLRENLDAATAQMKSMQRNALRAQVRAQIEQGKLPDLQALKAQGSE